MNRYKLTIEYDGKNFNGWQKQKNMKTVQGIIEESLFKFSGKKITIYGAGRTDTGVHASGQVAHFDIKESGLEDKNSKLGKLTMGVNFYLSRLSDNRVSILETKKVTDEFHSRFSAKGRKYKYSILDVSLEKLTQQKEKVSREIFDFCNLSWNKEILNFYNRKDLFVKTLSGSQVRQKIFYYEDKKYKPYIYLLNKYQKKYSWIKI